MELLEVLLCLPVGGDLSLNDHVPIKYLGTVEYQKLITFKNLMRFCFQVVVIIIFLVSPTQAQLAKRLWVLQKPNEIVEYDVVSFSDKRSIKVPPRLLEAPEYLTINNKGQMLFLPPHGVYGASGEMASAGDRIWFWNGLQEKEWSLEGTKTRRISEGKSILLETIPRCFLSAGGENLFWFENRFEIILDEDGRERSVRSSSRVWRTDLAKGRRETITNLSSAQWCQCGTGVCSETCPEWHFWAPDGVVNDFFLLTRFTPGQLGSTYYESLLYQPSGRMWQAKKLPQPIENPLAASEKGEIMIAAIPDGGCCGWDNVSNDQTLLLQRGKVFVLFDEFNRYGNRNYDVSFFTAAARLSPANTAVAYTIMSTARKVEEIRLSSNGKENAEELSRVRKAISELPAVEVMWLGSKPQPKTIIRHASLVGWLSDREIIIVQGDRLVVFDLQTNKRRETTIRVRSATDAFLR